MQLVTILDFFSLQSRYEEDGTAGQLTIFTIASWSVSVYKLPCSISDPPFGESAAQVERFNTLWHAFTAAYGILWTQNADSSALAYHQAVSAGHLQRLIEMTQELESIRDR